jgi:hypothetical protein
MSNDISDNKVGDSLYPKVFIMVGKNAEIEASAAFAPK